MTNGTTCGSNCWGNVLEYCGGYGSDIFEVDELSCKIITNKP